MKKKTLLIEAIHALTNGGIPKEILSRDGYDNIWIPFICRNGFVAYFVFDTVEKKIKSIEYDQVGMVKKISIDLTHK